MNLMKIINLNNIRLIKCADSHAQVFYPWSCYFTEKKKAHQIFTHKSPTTDFRATFLYDRRCLTSGKTKSRDENKVAATDSGKFYWERRLCLF